MSKLGKMVSGLFVATAILCAIVFIYAGGNRNPSAVVDSAGSSSKTLTQKVATSSHSASATTSSDDAEAKEAEYEAKYKVWWGKIVSVLSARGDAESMAAAAFLSRMAEPTFATTASSRADLLSRFARAAALAPNNPAIQSLALEVCYGASDCDPSQYESRLRAIDPQNALPWIGAVARAGKNEDTEALTIALSSMSKTERFDLYWAANIENVIHAVESVPIAPPDVPEPQHPAILHYQVAVATIGIAAAFALPPISPLTKACKSSASFADDCNRIALSMEHGDTFFSQGVGLLIEKSLVAPGSAEAMRVADARRQLDWLMRGQSLLTTSTPDPGQWLQLLDEKRNEVEATKALLAQNGLPVKPPPGWTRESEN